MFAINTKLAFSYLLIYRFDFSHAIIHISKSNTDFTRNIPLKVDIAKNKNEKYNVSKSSVLFLFFCP